jgi:signal transduction histidine kinase
MLLAGLAVALIMGGIFRAAFDFEGNKERFRVAAVANIRMYAEGVVGDLAPLSGRELTRALDTLARDRSLLARVRELATGEEWAATPLGNHRVSSAPAFEDFRPWRRSQRGSFQVGRAGRQGAAVIERGSRRYLIALPATGWVEFQGEYVVIAVILLLGVLAFIYWRVHRMLHPLHDLRAGVDALSRGQLSTRLPVSGRDELGALATDFNRMAAELEGMIAAREELLLGVSHELRTPLTRARLALEFLPEGERREQLGEDLLEMARLVEELLEFGRLRGQAPLELAPVDVSRVVADAIEAGGSNSPEPPNEGSAQVRLVVDPQLLEGNVPCLLVADAARLRRLVRNLVENALAYGHAPGEKARVEVLVARGPTGVWRINVRDEGPGIPGADAERVFEPFARLETSRSRAHGGLGLGLALSRRIAQAHGGSLELIRFAPRGAEFQLEIPE